LDIKLPHGNGFQLCKWLKARSNTLILFLSAKDLETDILNGYELGADDYVTKPFSMRILLKKVYVILSRKSQEANIYDDGFLKVDFELGIVQQGVNECLLSPTEYRILKKLIENKGKLLTYSVLLDSLWDEGVQITDKHTLIFQMYMEWVIYGSNDFYNIFFVSVYHYFCTLEICSFET